jgi:hypothetical protein
MDIPRRTITRAPVLDNLEVAVTTGQKILVDYWGEPRLHSRHDGRSLLSPRNTDLQQLELTVVHDELTAHCTVMSFLRKRNYVAATGVFADGDRHEPSTRSSRRFLLEQNDRGEWHFRIDTPREGTNPPPYPKMWGDEPHFGNGGWMNV